MALWCFSLISYFSLKFCSSKKKNRFYFANKKIEVVYAFKRFINDYREIVKSTNGNNDVCWEIRLNMQLKNFTKVLQFFLFLRDMFCFTKHCYRTNYIIKLRMSERVA
jgi:hypothetical protein